MLKTGVILDGKYEIVSVIGQGGTSVVYLAEHRKLHQKWAVKEIDRECCENYGMISRQLIAEADILKNLDHPGLPKIIDIIEENNTIWLIMEFIEGTTLKEIIKARGRIEEEQVLDWGRQLCQVLYYLHTRKPAVIYRDVKPSNIMIKKTGKVVLIDFGTAREYSDARFGEDTTYLGTRGYAAPEQYGGLGQTDSRTDIYGMGMTFYHMLTGYNPERSFEEICRTEEWKDYMSAGLRDIILKCTKYRSEDRYQDCKALSEALLQVKNVSHEQKQKVKMRIKIFVATVTCIFFSSMCFCTAFQYIDYGYREKKALSYVSCAEKSVDRNEVENNYRKALQTAADNGKVYDSLLAYFIKPQNFKIEDAAILTNLLITDIEGENALEILKGKHLQKYGEVCYEIGLGYFFDISGSTGKKMAESWFQEVVELDEKFLEKDKARRAGLYADICSYYNTFLTNGEDGSGERNQSDFYDFYRTLHNLNTIQITEHSTDSDVSAAWLVSKEVAVELASYGEGFLEHEKVTETMLKEELDRIRKREKLFKKKKDKEEVEELKYLVQDAERKIGTLSESKYKGDGGIAD